MDTRFLRSRVTFYPLVIGLILTIAYFILITFAFSIGNVWLFAFLIAGEIFHVFQVVMYIYTVWKTDTVFPRDESFTPTVDIFVTVAGEPVDIVRETVEAIRRINYPSFKTYLLNDGFVAKKDNWQEIEALAQDLNVGCITRKVAGGAKAGNINNGLRETSGQYVVIFDADHVPHEDFLQRTIPLMADQNVAFVQSPQYYKNSTLNYVTGSSWEQQQLFFGPICSGKNRDNAATMCGTNMVIQRKALLEVGGMSEESIAEDFLTGMRLHSKGYRSIYVPEVLAEGLAPEDFLSYYKQQFRWARGALDMIFGKHTLFNQKLTLKQRLQYFSSVSFYLSGLVVAIDALIPVAFFFTGQVPLTISTMTLALVFLPYLFLTLYILDRSSNSSFTFRSLAFSIAGFNIHLQAILGALLRRKAAFVVTPKRQQEGNFINLVIPHLIYIALVIVGGSIAFMREGLSASFITNLAWALLNIAVFVPFMHAAIWGSKS